MLKKIVKTLLSIFAMFALPSIYSNMVPTNVNLFNCLFFKEEERWLFNLDRFYFFNNLLGISIKIKIIINIVKNVLKAASILHYINWVRLPYITAIIKKGVQPHNNRTTNNSQLNKIGLHAFSIFII